MLASHPRHCRRGANSTELLVSICSEVTVCMYPSKTRLASMHPSKSKPLCLGLSLTHTHQGLLTLSHTPRPPHHSRPLPKTTLLSLSFSLFLSHAHTLTRRKELRVSYSSLSCLSHSVSDDEERLLGQRERLLGQRDRDTQLPPYTNSYICI